MHEELDLNLSRRLSQSTRTKYTVAKTNASLIYLSNNTILSIDNGHPPLSMFKQVKTAFSADFGGQVQQMASKLPMMQ